MPFRRWVLPLPALIVPAVGLALLLTVASAQPSATVRGIVVDARGPVAGTTVRVRATENVTTSTPSGHFTLAGLEEGQEIEVTAWAEGYYVASTHVTPTVAGVTLTLRPYHTHDHRDYSWAAPSVCQECHPMIVPQWQNNAHGRAVDNPRFYSLYNGTNLTGTVRVGAGYVNDFPGTAGNCASCHAPGAGVDGYLSTGMNQVREVTTAGVHCDFCHKVGGVYLNPASGSVYPNVPGVESQRLLRPPAGDNIFFGPYDDIHDPDTYLPAISQSRFCAPCHQFSFWGTPIYESYNEWLASPYPALGVTCQDCHMPPTGDRYFALPEVGGLPHPPESIPSHLQLGAASESLLQRTVSMTLELQQTPAGLLVTVAITNTKAGHHVPTDHPGRNLILAITATDALNRPLPYLGDQVVPSWGGVQAGMPGKAFAKVLRDRDTGEMPVVSYWKQAFVDSDNRLPALGTDRSTYSFALPEDRGEARVTARLIFRRLFAPLAAQKGWLDPDILMAEQSEQSALVQNPRLRAPTPEMGR